MPDATIDACCLIDLLASGHAAAVLRASGFAWQLPIAVQAEVRYVRQPDPADATAVVRIAADLGPLLNAGVLTLCQCETESETDSFVRYAAQFRSDGEAMCLALAENRGCSVATDDRKAIRVARQTGLHVLSSPELLKTWAENERPQPKVISQALQSIERLAQFRPNESMPAYRWWTDRLNVE